MRFFSDRQAARRDGNAAGVQQNQWPSKCQRQAQVGGGIFNVRIENNFPWSLESMGTL